MCTDCGHWGRSGWSRWAACRGRMGRAGCRLPRQRPGPPRSPTLPVPPPQNGWSLPHSIQHTSEWCHMRHNIHSISKWLISATQYSTHFRMVSYETQHTFHLKMADLCHTIFNTLQNGAIWDTTYIPSQNGWSLPHSIQQLQSGAIQNATYITPQHTQHLKMADLCHTQHAQLACSQYSNGECSHLLSGCTKGSHDSCLSKETEIAVCNCALFTAG